MQAHRRILYKDAVKSLLGHASVATTQVYVAVDDDDLTRAAAGAWAAA